ncbi:MAG: hypothetical protein Q8M16_24635 [Pirellulaceae bacterium]|nr:hypothetical protein [Pirellulaceae bacterium]
MDVLSLLLAQESPNGLLHNVMSATDIVKIVAVSCMLGGPILIAIVYIVFQTLWNMVRMMGDNSLKKKMLTLGFSVTDIERVLRAENVAVKSSKPARPSTPDVVMAQTIK